ncbi:MAG: hypothetical protein WBG88_12700 [Mesorhizobium sp.]
MPGSSKAVLALALVLLLAIVAACASFGVIPTLLTVAIAASAAILATMLGVAMNRHGY